MLMYIFNHFFAVLSTGFETRQEYDEILENHSDLEEFSEDYVVGSWGNSTTIDGHYQTIDLSGYLTDYVEILKAASYEADHGYYAGAVQKDKMILHGGTILNEKIFSPSDPKSHAGQNYVSDVRYLYQAACEVYNGNVLPDIGIYTDVSSDTKIIAQYIMNLDLPDIDNALEDTKEGRAAKILGFAIHLTGDVYAHRTMVPESCITNKEIDSSHFESGEGCDVDSYIKRQAFLKTLITDDGKSLCNHYACLEIGIQKGVIETKDITAWDSDKYEDTATFLSKRFDAAKISVKYIMGRFRTRATLNDAVFLPSKNSVDFGLDLNGLYKFYKETGWATTDIPVSPYDGTRTRTQYLY